jgi:hypothetical protein
MLNKLLENFRIHAMKQLSMDEPFFGGMNIHILVFGNNKKINVW